MLFLIKSIGSFSKKGVISTKENEENQFDVFCNKMPDWSEVLKSYVLNFNGRVKKSSPKNFQLIEENNCVVLFLI